MPHCLDCTPRSLTTKARKCAACASGVAPRPAASPTLPLLPLAVPLPPRSRCNDCTPWTLTTDPNPCLAHPEQRAVSFTPSGQRVNETRISETDVSIKCWCISILRVSELFEAPNRAIAEKYAERCLAELNWGDLTDVSCEAFVQEWDLDTNEAAHGSEASAVSIDLPLAPDPIAAANTARCYGCGQTREVKPGEGCRRLDARRPIFAGTARRRASDSRGGDG
jgi:hypothetical protein